MIGWLVSTLLTDWPVSKHGSAVIGNPGKKKHHYYSNNKLLTFVQKTAYPLLLMDHCFTGLMDSLQHLKNYQVRVSVNDKYTRSGCSEAR